jgi:hypothetical protein
MWTLAQVRASTEEISIASFIFRAARYSPPDRFRKLQPFADDLQAAMKELEIPTMCYTDWETVFDEFCERPVPAVVRR